MGLSYNKLHFYLPLKGSELTELKVTSSVKKGIYDWARALLIKALQ